MKEIPVPSDRTIRVQRRLVPGLLVGGLLFTAVGVGMHWLYFARDGNPPLLVIGLVIFVVGMLFLYLTVSAYTSCLEADESGITRTSLWTGLTHIRWDEVGHASEEPGVEHGLRILKVVSAGGKRIEVYSNWLADYDRLFAVVSRHVGVDTSASRVEGDQGLSQQAEGRDSKAETAADEGNSEPPESPGVNLRLRVTGTQVLYWFATLAVSAFMIWRAIRS